MNFLDIVRLMETPVADDPFRHVVVQNFIPPEHWPQLAASFPMVPGPGSHPPGALRLKGAFQDLMQELEGAAFRDAVAAKFDIDLKDRPLVGTVRGFLRAKDGGIHRDAPTKLVTVLLYLNDDWAEAGGRLRLLRSAGDLDDFAVEITPRIGTLLIFCPSATSWHGHKPFAGARRTLQLNWVTSPAVARREMARHHVSTALKRLARLMR